MGACVGAGEHVGTYGRHILRHSLVTSNSVSLHEIFVRTWARNFLRSASIELMMSIRLLSCSRKPARMSASFSGAVAVGGDSSSAFVSPAGSAVTTVPFAATGSGWSSVTISSTFSDILFKTKRLVFTKIGPRIGRYCRLCAHRERVYGKRSERRLRENSVKIVRWHFYFREQFKNKPDEECIS